jgi:hypothetical protein
MFKSDASAPQLGSNRSAPEPAATLNEDAHSLPAAEHAVEAVAAAARAYRRQLGREDSDHDNCIEAGEDGRDMQESSGARCGADDEDVIQGLMNDPEGESFDPSEFEVGDRACALDLYLND